MKYRLPAILVLLLSPVLAHAQTAPAGWSECLDAYPAEDAAQCIARIEIICKKTAAPEGCLEQTGLMWILHESAQSDKHPALKQYEGDFFKTGSFSTDCSSSDTRCKVTIIVRETLRNRAMRREKLDQ